MELQGQDWRIIPGSYEKNKPAWDVYVYPVFKHSDGDVDMSRVMLSSTEAVVLVSFDGKGYGALKINDKMKVIRIIDTEERVIVFEEVKYSYQSPQVNSDRIYWTTGDGLISVLNSSMKPLTYTVIPKRFRLNGPVGLSSSLHVKDNKIVLVSGYDKGKGRTAIYAQIDASSGKIETIEEFKKDEIGGNYQVYPQATLWFDDSFILSYLDVDGAMLRIKRIQANLQKFSY